MGALRSIASAALALGLLAGCQTDPLTTPPHLVEPLPSALTGPLDRTLVRVRMNRPGTDDSPAAALRDDGTHASWRINGSGGNEAINHAYGMFPDGDDFVFAPTLLPGENHLEVGRCNDLDDCGWTAVDLTVNLKSGSPDPKLGGTGQLVLDGFSGASTATLLPDGRVLLGAETKQGTRLLAMRSDGKLDTTFGDKGVATLPCSGMTARPLLRSDGTFLVTVTSGAWSRVLHLLADGSVDAFFGTNDFVELPDAGNLRSFVADGAGHYWLAGVAGSRASLTQLAEDGTVLSATFVDDGSSSMALDAVVDASGSVALLKTDRLLRGGVAGVSSTTMLDPASSGAVAFVGSEVAIVQGVASATGAPLSARVRIGASTIDVPFAMTNVPDRPFRVAAAADGSVYVVANIDHPPDGGGWSLTPQAGSDFAVARIRAGALDATFGQAGIAHASFLLSWRPIATDTMLDQPAAIWFGSDGAPWLAGLTPGGGTDGFSQRGGPGIGVVRFLP